MRRRVALTGVGAVTPIGNDAASTWTALLAGRSGVAPIQSFDAGGFPVRIAAEVKGFDTRSAVADRKLEKYTGRFHAFALAAAAEALRDAGVQPTPADAERWGCTVGSGMMGVSFAELERLQAECAPQGELDPARFFAADAACDPIAFCRNQTVAGLWLLLQRFGIRGPASCQHTACASGGQAVGAGLRLIRRGLADRVLAGGFDSMINPIGLGGFCLLGALSTDNDTPARASRPFDATRNGFVLGEGAGFLVLEEWALARGRGAPIYAEVLGQGDSLSSYRITDSHPSGDGAIQAMRRALADAGVAAAEVSYLNAHGTSTTMNDRSECAAVHAVFGAQAERIAVSSTKSLTGHLIAAAGAIEAIFCALALRDGVLPISANLVEPDPACDLDFVRGEPRRCAAAVALSNSFGFGGTNNTLVFRRAEGAVRAKPALP